MAMKSILQFSIFLILLVPIAMSAQGDIVPLYQGVPDCANEQVEEAAIDDRIGRRISRVHEPSIEVFLPKGESNGTGVVICPGGGYKILAYDWEGTRMAEWFSEMGVAAFVLKYRLPHWESSDCRDKVALDDAQTAMKLVRANADKYQIDPDRLGVMGFSAGGHLASTLSTHYDEGSRPDFSILMYPVVTMDPEVTHGGSKTNLLGENPSAQMIEHFSNELQVDENTPPTILIHAADDKAVLPENSIRYYQALLKSGVPAAMHIYESGGHGFSFAEGLGSVENWPQAVETWLDDHGLLKQPAAPKEAADMVAAATELMAQLSLNQNKALFEFDHETRSIWTFLPVASVGRPGVALRDLNEEQISAVHKLISSGLSAEGHEKVKAIIALEKILQVLEPNNAGRDPEQYHIALYGKPGLTGKWGWKFEGHHVALNFTMVDGEVVGVPTFLGSNPAMVKSGEQTGLRVLQEEEDLAFDIINSLTYREQRQAMFQEKAPYEILSQSATQTGPLEDVGLLVSNMNSGTAKKLNELIETYLAIMPDYLQERRRKQLDEAGRENIRFAWAGATALGKAHYYRIQGPTFMIEFANTQNEANHAHAVWRDYNGDFGRDLLREHMTGQ